MRQVSIAMLSSIVLLMQSTLWGQVAVPVEVKPGVVEQAPAAVIAAPLAVQPAPVAVQPVPGTQAPVVIGGTYTTPLWGSYCGSGYASCGDWGGSNCSYVYPFSGCYRWRCGGCWGRRWGCGWGCGSGWGYGSSWGCGSGWGYGSCGWGGCSHGWYRPLRRCWRRCGSGWVCSVESDYGSIGTALPVIPSTIATQSYAMGLSSERAARIAELAAVEPNAQQTGVGTRLVSATVVRPSTVTLDPSLAEVYYRTGYNAYWSQDYESALKALDLALSASDQDARVWYYKGFAESALKKDDAAVESFARAVRLQLDHPAQSGRIHRSLERIQGHLRGQIQTALKDAGSVHTQPTRKSPAKPKIQSHVAQH